MYLPMLSLAEQLAGEGFTSEKLMPALTVVGIGMAVVFGVLLLLILILQVFKLFAVKKPAENKATEVSSPAPAAPAVVPASSDTVDGATVAVISSAIAASMGKSECDFAIISIKKL